MTKQDPLRILHIHSRRRVEKVLIVLRDGRKLIGVLRSYDQYGENHVSWRFIWQLIDSTCLTCGPRRSANLVLEAAMERIYHGLQWAQIPRGLFLIRGENVVLLGEVVSSSLMSAFTTLILRISCRTLISKTRCHCGKHRGRRCTERFRQKRYAYTILR